MEQKSGDTCSSDRRDTVDTASLVGTGGWGSQEGPGNSHGNSHHSNSTSTNCWRHHRWNTADTVESLKTKGSRKVSLQCPQTSSRGSSSRVCTCEGVFSTQCVSICPVLLRSSCCCTWKVVAPPTVCCPATQGRSQPLTVSTHLHR